jgi:RNA polymerase sigma factor (sigma-70 family)
MTEGGLEAVFMAQRSALTRFLRARGAGTDAEDLVQELWVKIASFKPGPVAEPVAYLYRMADNLMLDRRRSDQRRGRRNEQWSDVNDGLADIAVQPSAERVLIARDTLRAVETVLADLGERTNMVFRRFRIDGVSQRDIATELGVSLSSVEKHLQKAYRALLRVEEASDADSALPRRPDGKGVSDVIG